jgi:hypothetical protein
MADQEGMARLPMPAHLPPQADQARSLAFNVRGYFRTLYESNEAFRDHLASVGNKDAITGNRLFDRREAVDMIKEAATKAKDSLTVNAKAGEIYKYVTRIMGKNGLGLKLRREAYKALTHQAPAE